ncbi:replication initiation protein [Streptomyces platensis]|uniref:replication initiator n=1 Tax=Streptomyces platensis TaxID=58346 RepID=UPI00224D6A7B|nr:replication initiator [Streptomyces platensis]MCX4640840.1 replication initiation protein [Streptomyces platensis]
MPRVLDLRHMKSLAVRDLIELANLGDFDRVNEQVRQVAGCTRPVNLVGQTTTLDATTRNVLRSYSTANEPTGRLLTTCGNRRASRCPACSRVYAADTYHLIKAGLSGGKTVPEAVRTHPRVFATLTAPSFGPVHNRPTDKPRCACGAQHAEDASELGTPLRPSAYDYTGAVLWNAHAGALWARTTTYIRRALAAHLGMTQKALNAALRISFAKVAEYQKRGLVHFHAVIRLDGPKGSNQPPPTWATVDALKTAIESATIKNAAESRGRDTRARLTVTSAHTGDREIRWGDRLDVREITALGDGELTDKAVAGYVAKYATKSAEDSGTVDRSLICAPCGGRGYQTGPDGYRRKRLWKRADAPRNPDGSRPRLDIPPGRFRDLCPHCEGTGQTEPIENLPVQDHVRRMIGTAWELGQFPEFADLKLSKWAHMLGFRGHFSTKSRRYSTTLGALRDVRRAWRVEQARARAGLHAPDESSTLVTESSWAYLASGYRPGEELLAAQVRYEIKQELRFRQEEGDLGAECAADR